MKFVRQEDIIVWEVQKIGTVTSAAMALVDSQGLSGNAADCPSIFSHLPGADLGGSADARH
jgi:hypothetical protein